MQSEFCSVENTRCILFQLHTFSLSYFRVHTLCVHPFSIPRRAGIKCTPKAAPPPAAGKKYAYYPDTRSARRLAIPAAGLRFSRHKVHTLGRPVSRHKVHIFTALFSPFFFIFFFFFLKKVHTLGRHRGSRQGKRKSAYTRQTPKPLPQDAFLRQKVYTLGSPRFALFHMHTRQPRLYDILRKSAYTSRTPKPPPPRAKSAYTRQPRVSYKKYAYYPDTIRQKVHTLAGHPPAVLRAKSVYTRLPSLFQTLPPLPP